MDTASGDVATAMADDVRQPLGEDGMEARIQDALREVLGGVDVNIVTIGKVRAAVEQHLGLQIGGLAPHLEVFKRLATDHVNAMLGAAGEGDAESSDAQDDEELASTPAKASRKRQREDERHRHPKRPKLRRRPKVGSHELPLEALPVTIAGVPVQLEARQFQSGRKGYFACEGAPVQYGGKVYHVQFMVQCAIVEMDDAEVEKGVDQEAADMEKGVDGEGVSEDAEGKLKTTVEGEADAELPSDALAAAGA